MAAPSLENLLYVLYVCIFPRQAMIDRNRTESPDADSPVTYGFARFAVGWAYMIFHLIGSGYVSIPHSAFFLSCKRVLQVVKISSD